MARKKDYSKDKELRKLAEESREITKISGAVLVNIKEEMDEIEKRTKDNWNKISLLL